MADDKSEDEDKTDESQEDQENDQYFPDDSSEGDEEDSESDDVDIRDKKDKFVDALQKYADPDKWFGKIGRRRKYAGLPPDAIRYVGFNDRMLAGIIDSVIMMFLLYPIFVLLSNTLYAEYNPSQVFQAMARGEEIRQIFASPEAIRAISMWAINNLLQLFVLVLLTFIFWVYSSATIGKWILRMRIVKAKDGTPPSKLQFGVRFIGYMLSPILGGITILFSVPEFGFTIGMSIGMVVGLFGFIWVAWDDRKQGWHDKLAGTVVIKVKHWKLRPTGESEFPDSFFEDDEEE